MTSSESQLETTVLEAEHVACGAHLVDFHGWRMPMRYGSIPEEHLAVRASAGIFDLCHMGRLELRGPVAALWLDRVVTGDVSALTVGDARYTLVVNEAGMIIDDAIVYRLEGSYLLVVNASNRLRVKSWLEAHRPPGQVELADRTFDWAMLAVQGPRAREITAPLLEHPQRSLDELRYYQITAATYDGRPIRVARTGYTGEDGYEIYLDSAQAPAFWRRVLELGGGGVVPVGLGARDTLRLEAGMPLYGSEIDETTHPFEARLGFAVRLDKATPFVGQERLRALRLAEPARRLYGLRVEGRRIARQGMAIHIAGGRAVGRITSGAPSPTLGCPIAMGYIEEAAARDHAGSLAVDLRGKEEKVTIEALPFYSRTRKKSS